jgi:hypothetical protein
VLAIGAGRAQALPIIGDQTIVLLTSADALSGAGISIDPLGTAIVGTDIVGRAEAAFPITGGDLTGPGLFGTIEHDGSGIRLSTASATVDLENFEIDFDALQVFGDVTEDGTPGGNAALFDVDPCSNLFGTAAQCIDGDGSILLDGWKLSLTEGAADALSMAFGLPFTTGAQVGVARIDVRFVPEPGTALLVGIGLAAVAARRTRSTA